jgi:uncharacterized protein with HEPN domain
MNKIVKKENLGFVDFIGHILQGIERINNYIEDVDELVFLQSELIQDAVIRNIENIGEAARNIETRYPNLAAQYNEVPWSDVYLMRNRVSHGYFSVDLEVIWRTIERDIPVLECQIKEVIRLELIRQSALEASQNTIAENDTPTCSYCGQSCGGNCGGTSFRI